MITRFVLALLLCCTCPLARASDSLFIKIHFLYGSKPAPGFAHSESKRFGGMKGGHVTIEAGNTVVGFVPTGRCHLWPHKNKKRSCFTRQSHTDFASDTSGEKYCTIVIPVSPQQYQQLLSIHQQYLDSSPYDYAVLGMRCAAATYDIMSRAGLVKKRSRFSNVIAHCYPQLLRRRLIRLARQRGYTIVRTPGRTSRKWEKE